MSYASEQGILNAQWNTAMLAQQVEDERLRPFMLLKPSVFPDGANWCALYGEDLQNGVAGFGETPDAASRDFDKNWREQRLQVGKGAGT